MRALVQRVARARVTVDGEEVLRKTSDADEFVTGAVAGVALVAAAAAGLLAFSRGWLGMVTCGVLSCVLLLRSRIFRGFVQRLWLLVPGFGAPALLAIGAARSLAPGRTIALVLDCILQQMINGRMASADGSIKTFVLRGISESPPYLHDGRLLTLEDTIEFFNLVLELQLTQEEKVDLLAFLRCL